jgi:tetratricopeptide (TPR) repeat protein
MIADDGHIEHTSLGDLAELVAKLDDIKPEQLASFLSAAVAIVGPELTKSDQARSLILLAERAFETQLLREAIVLTRPIIDSKDTLLTSADERLNAYIIVGSARKELADVREAVHAFALAEDLVDEVENKQLVFQYHLNYAATLHDSGLTKAALEHFAAATAHWDVTSDHMRAALHLNRSMALLADERPVEAIEDLKKGLALNIGSLETRLRTSLGNAYSRAGELDQAQESYARALDSIAGPDPRMEARIRNNLGRLLLKRGEHDRSIQEIELGLKLRRESGDVLGQVASLRFKAEALQSLGREREAQPLLDEAVDLLASLDHPDLDETFELVLALDAQIAGRDTIDANVAAVAAALFVPGRSDMADLIDAFPALTDERAEKAWNALEERFAVRPAILFRIRARRDLVRNLSSGQGANEPGGGHVRPVLQDLIQAKDMATLESVLRTHHHEVLTDTALRMIDATRAVWMNKQREDIVQHLDRIRKLIDTSRLRGIESGLAEFREWHKQIDDLCDLGQAYLRQTNWLARKRFFQRHADRLLRDEFAIALRQLNDTFATEPAVLKQLDCLSALWGSCREKDLDLAFAELPAENTGELLSRMVSVGTWEETRQLVNVHCAQLATDETLELLRGALDDGDKGSLNWHRIKDHIELLEACRSGGIEGAFAHRSGSKMYFGQMPADAALRSSIDTEPLDDIGRLEAMIRSLETAAPEPLLLGALHNSVACRYLEREAEDEGTNLGKAEAHLSKALGMLDPAVHPQTASRVMNNAGNLYKRYALIRPDERDKLFLRAIRFYEDALLIQSPGFMTETSRITARNLHEALVVLGKEFRSPALVARVADVCATALDATDELARGGSSDEIRELVEGVEWAVRGAVRHRFALRQFGAALEASERGKGRAFAARLIESDRAVPTRVPPELVEREHVARAELAAAQEESRESDDPATDFARAIRISKANEKLDAVYHDMEPHAPDFVAVRRSRPMDFVELERFWTESRRLCLEWHFQEDGAYLFVLGPEMEIEGYSIPLTFGKLVDFLKLAIDDFWNPPEEPEHPISPIWANFADQLFPQECRARICAAQAVTLVPNGIQRLIPIHALPISWLAYEPLIAKMPVRYVPSLTMGRRLAQRARRNCGRTVAFGYAGQVSSDDAFEQEARVAAAASSYSDLFLGREASFERLKGASPSAGIIHLSCHGFFDPAIPTNSGLVLAASNGNGERVVTAEDIVSSLHFDSALIVLSGCETAQADLGTVDEMVGLVRALFIAGAGSIVAALWRVDAKVTADLMRQFYTLHRDSSSAAESLRQAALLIRARPITCHPYYWAPFIAYES